ncbi:glycosyltransferase family 4 protein [Candidatus Microgenomates bacterium]|nr:glycosyltransferase family 4 protein [Candidatus Microgenomates bacterium]
MTIGFDGSRAFGEDRTGTENYSYQLLKALAKIDTENTYLIYIKSFIVDAAASLMKLPENFKVIEIPWIRLWTQGGLALQTFKDQLDVLFVPAHTLPIIRRPGLKTMVTIHDLGSEYLPQMHQLKQQLYLSFIQRVQLRGATKIITVSNATKKDLVKRVGIDSNKVAVVYEGYDSDLFKPIKGELLVNRLRYYGLVPGRYFLFVGTVQPRKNLERVVKAFSVHLRGVDLPKPRFHLGGEQKLVIAGSKGWLSSEIYKLPKKLGIEDRVKFLGYVPEKDLPALYSGAIALVFPSLFEGFGLPILEAQACGCPVLTSNISSMPEVAGPPTGGGAILVNPYSIEDIIRGMREIGEIRMRDRLRKAGFENIKRFSWEKCAKQTLEVFANL